MVLMMYPNINPSWLLHGEGDVLRTNIEKDCQSVKIGDLKEIFKTLRFFRRTCQELKEKLAVYEQKNKTIIIKLKSDGSNKSNKDD